MWSLPRRTRLYFVIAGLVFITGAIGFEFLGALMLHVGFAEHDLIYRLRRVAEEGCEMYGIAIFNCALFRGIVHRDLIVSASTARKAYPA